MTNSETKHCQNCKNQFIIEPDDFAFYEKMKVPAPTWCPQCRRVRRLAWRNQRSLHKRNCDKCGKSMISVFAPDSGLIVYCSPCWWSDAWNASDYAVDFDPTKPFIAQVRELLNKVPVMNLFGLYTTLVDSDYTNMVSYLKNCYMVTYSDYAENVFYGAIVNHSKDCVDNFLSEQSELCYDTVNCIKCYRAFYSNDCQDCVNVYFSKNCVGCNDCFGCANLKGKQYYIFNEPHSKEEFEKFVAENTKSFEAVEAAKKKAYAFWEKFPRKYIHGTHNNNVSGEYILNSKNTFNSYLVMDVEDSKFCSFITAGGTKDCYDFDNYGIKSSLLYEVMQAGDQASRVRFSWWAVTNTYDIEYSIFSVSSKNLFGCVGMKKREYCILNKQYSKEEYARLRETIISQMNDMPYQDKLGRLYPYGEFFPAQMSPFGYNETTAQEFFPLTFNEAEKSGFNWREIQASKYEITKQPETLPVIDIVSDDITKEVIGCLHKGDCQHQCPSAFKIIPQELQFYRKLKIPLPRLCPNCRHGERLVHRNPMTLWPRACQCAGRVSQKDVYTNSASHFHGQDSCPNEFETSYSPDRPEIVYCEQCYQAEVA
jgi:hypothetical protein